MELITYIENYTKYEIPSFRHPMKNMNSSNKPDQSNSDQYYSSGITIPDKIIFSPTVTPFVNDDGNQIQCYLLFGYNLKLKDWESIRILYPQLSIKVKLYKGNQMVQVSQSTINAKSFIKGQKKINDCRTLIKKDENQKHLQTQVHIYTVQITSQSEPENVRVIYYLPSVFDKNSKQHSFQCIKARYFNHKILQILNEYVSFDNNNISCFKDLAHYQFQSLVYSGRLKKFQVLIKLGQNWSNKQVSQSFIQKLSEISMTDKHLLDQVDPLDFGEIKKQIRSMYLQQKRIRKTLTFQKLKIVQQIQNILHFLNLKQAYPKKLKFGTITSQMLKRIGNQNIDNKTLWIKQQYFIIRNLDARIIDLEHTKTKYKQTLMEETKANNQIIQQIRNQIKFYQTSIKYQQAEIINRNAHATLNNKQNNNRTKQKTNENSLKDNKKTKNGMQRFDTEGSKISDKLKAKQQQKKKINNDDALLCKKDIDQLQKQRILKYQMIKAQFQMEKQFIRRKAQYAKAAQQIHNYLGDC